MNNKRAFPLAHEDGSFQDGMSLRDYFAARAMQSLLIKNDIPSETVSKLAYFVADAMLEAREN